MWPANCCAWLPDTRSWICMACPRKRQAGTAVSAAFPHLAPVLKADGFITQADLAARMTAPRMALFAAAPHAVSAGVIATCWRPRQPGSAS